MPRTVINPEDIKYDAFYLSPEDNIGLMPNFEKLVTRILVKYVPGLEHIFSKVSNHIEHKYSKQMSQKSKVVSAHFF